MGKGLFCNLYSHVPTEIGNLGFGVAGPSQYQCTVSDAVSAFNKTSLPNADFTGFKAHITQSDGVTLRLEHPNASTIGPNTGTKNGWDISRGIFFIFSKYMR